MRKLVLAVIFLFAAAYTHAQTWEIGGEAGTAGYIGDLNPHVVNVSGINGGLFVKRNFNGYIAAKLNYSYARIGGADSTSGDPQFRERNLSFKTSLRELSLLAEFNFMKYIPDAGHNKYTPYIYLGLGVTYYNPEAIYQGQTVTLRNLRTEGQPAPYKNYATVIPYGAGIKYNFSGKFTVAADVGYRYTNTDYLDDVSGLYAVRGRLPNATSVALADRSGERTGRYTGSPGSQRGDLRPKDTYMFFGFTLSYTFVTQRCYYEN